MPAGPPGLSTPWRSAPSAVLRLEEATEPRRRARIQANHRRLPVSDRLRRHLSQIAALLRDRQASRPGPPPISDASTVRAVDSRPGHSTPPPAAAPTPS